MRLFRRRRKPGASEKGRARSERLQERELTPRKKTATPEDMLEALNYEAADSEADSAEEIRGAWGAIAAIVAALVLLMLIGLLIHLSGGAGASWRAWRAAPLLHAARDGRADEVRSLLAGGADPNAAGREGDTPLRAAIRGAHAEIADALVQAGAEPTREAIDAALRYDRRDMLIALVEAGGDPDTRGSWTDRSLLEGAVAEGDRELAHVLLAHGADPDVAPGGSPLFPPALHIAIDTGQVAMVRLLVEHGADPMLKHQGWTAVAAAANAGQQELAQMLLEAAQEAGGGAR